MDQDRNSDTYYEEVRQLSLDIPQKDINFLLGGVNLLKDTDPKAIEELNNDDMQLGSLNLRGSKDCRTIPEPTGSPADSTGISTSFPIAEQSPSQDDNKLKQEHQIQTEERELKLTEKTQTQQEKVQQNAISSAEDQRSTRSTINTLASGDQAAKHQDFAEGAARLCINRDEQGENQIIDYHSQIEEDKKDGNMTGPVPEEPFPWEQSDPLFPIFKEFFDNLVFDQSLFIQKKEEKESNLLPKSKKIYKEDFKELANSKPTKNKKRGNKKTKQDLGPEEELEIRLNKYMENQEKNQNSLVSCSFEYPFYPKTRTVSEATDSLALSDSSQQEIEEEQQDQIELEEGKEFEQKKDLEIQQEKDLKNFILNRENQESPSSTITLIYKVQIATEEGIPIPDRNQQEVKDTIRNENIIAQRPQKEPAPEFWTGINDALLDKNVKSKGSNILPNSKPIQKREKNETKKKPQKDGKTQGKKTEQVKEILKSPDQIDLKRENFDPNRGAKQIYFTMEEFIKTSKKPNKRAAQSEIKNHFEETKTNANIVHGFLKEKKISFSKDHSNFLENESTPETAASPTLNSIQSSPQGRTKRKEKGPSQKRKKDSEKEEKILTPEEKLKKCLSRQSQDRFQTVPMAFSKILKIDQVKLKAFKDKRPQLDEKGFEFELIKTVSELLFQLRWQEKSAENKAQNHQDGMKEKPILSFENFEKFKEDICHEFGEEFFDDYLMYETFMRLLQIQCQKLQIDPQTVEKYLVDEIIGAKDDEGHKVKIRTKADVKRLLHSDLEISDSEELKRKKSGARLAIDIHFRAGFYERSIIKHIQKCTKENTRAHAQEVLNFFIENKSKLYKEFLSSNEKKKNVKKMN